MICKNNADYAPYPSCKFMRQLIYGHDPDMSLNCLLSDEMPECVNPMKKVSNPALIRGPKLTIKMATTDSSKIRQECQVFFPIRFFQSNGSFRLCSKTEQFLKLPDADLNNVSQLCRMYTQSSQLLSDNTTSMFILNKPGFAVLNWMLLPNSFLCCKSKGHGRSSICQTGNLGMSKSVKLRSLSSIKMVLSKNSVAALSKMQGVNENTVASAKMRPIQQHADVNSSETRHIRVMYPSSASSLTAEKIETSVGQCIEPKVDLMMFMPRCPSKTNSVSTPQSLHYFQNCDLLRLGHDLQS